MTRQMTAHLLMKLAWDNDGKRNRNDDCWEVESCTDITDDMTVESALTKAKQKFPKAIAIILSYANQTKQPSSY